MIFVNASITNAQWEFTLGSCNTRLKIRRFPLAFVIDYS
jgi:hypothetical protein